MWHFNRQEANFMDNGHISIYHHEHKISAICRLMVPSRFSSKKNAKRSNCVPHVTLNNNLPQELNCSNKFHHFSQYFN